MTEILKMVSDIKEAQDTIDGLLESSRFVKSNGDRTWSITGDVKWKATSLYNDEECNIGLGVFAGDPKTDITGSIPHLHKNSKEFFIITRGRVALYINSKFARTLRVGDVGIVPSRDTHQMKSLDKDTRLIFVCVPADEIYTNLFTANE